MRTTGMMGEVVGMAASLCKKYDVTPRGVYRSHLEDLKTLMKEGVNKKGLPNNQRYNEGGILKINRLFNNQKSMGVCQNVLVLCVKRGDKHILTHTFLILCP